MGFASPLSRRRKLRTHQPQLAIVNPQHRDNASSMPNDIQAPNQSFRQHVKNLLAVNKGGRTTGASDVSKTNPEDAAVVQAEQGPVAQAASGGNPFLQLLVETGSKHPKREAVIALVRSTVHTTAVTLPSAIASKPGSVREASLVGHNRMGLTSSATTKLTPKLPSKNILKQDTGLKTNKAEDGLTADDLAVIYGDPVKPLKGRSRASPAPPILPHEIHEEPQPAYLTPKKTRKRATSAPPKPPLPEKVKHTVLHDSPISSKYTFSDEKAEDTPNASVKAHHNMNDHLKEGSKETKAYDSRLGIIKSKHEDEMICLRREHEAKLAAEKGVALHCRESKQHSEERASKAEKECKLTKERLAVVESEMEALRQRYSTTVHMNQVLQSKTTDTDPPKVIRKIMPLPARKQDQAPNDSTTEQQPVEIARERDQLKEYNINLRQKLDRMQEKTTSLEKQVVEHRNAFEDRDHKLYMLRQELEHEPNKTATTDGLLEGKAARYNDLVREYNEVIGQNSKLQAKFEDLEAQRKEEVGALEFELNEYKVNEKYVLKSRDLHRLASKRMVNRLRYKMTAGDVEKMTDCAWYVISNDCEALCEKVSWLRRCLRSCNKRRLETNNECRSMRRIYDAKIRQNEELLEYKRDTEVQLEILQDQLKNHVPACKRVIAEKDAQIVELKQQMAAAAKRYEKQIQAGANNGALMLLEDKEDTVTQQRHRLEAQNKELNDLDERLAINSYYMEGDEVRKQEYVERMESLKARAIAAEEEVANLRQQLDKGDEGLADPRKWEHFQKCSEWKAQAKIVVEEHQEKAKKIQEVIEGLWERMRDFEHQAKQNGLPDPDDCLEEDRRDQLAAIIKELFVYNIDWVIQRRTDGDIEPELEPSDHEGEDDDSGTAEGIESDNDGGSDDDSESFSENNEELAGEADKTSEPQQGWDQHRNLEDGLAVADDGWDTTEGSLDGPKQDPDAAAPAFETTETPDTSRHELTKDTQDTEASEVEENL